MLWMGIWVPPYTVTHVQFGVHDDSWGWVCGKVCIPATQMASHILIIIHISVFACCYVLDGDMAPPLHCYDFLQVGQFHSKKFEVCLRLSDIVLSLLKLQTNTDCIPQHPHHM